MKMGINWKSPYIVIQRIDKGISDILRICIVIQRHEDFFLLSEKEVLTKDPALLEMTDLLLRFKNITIKSYRMKIKLSKTRTTYFNHKDLINSIDKNMKKIMEIFKKKESMEGYTTLTEAQIIERNPELEDLMEIFMRFRNIVIKVSGGKRKWS